MLTKQAVNAPHPDQFRYIEKRCNEPEKIRQRIEVCLKNGKRFDLGARNRINAS